MSSDTRNPEPPDDRSGRAVDDGSSGRMAKKTIHFDGKAASAGEDGGLPDCGNRRIDHALKRAPYRPRKTRAANTTVLS